MQAGDRVGADHDADRDVAGVERPVHVARQHRQHGADREQAAEGDREDAGEGEAGAGNGGCRRAGRGAHRSRPERSSMTWSGGGSAASASAPRGRPAEDQDRLEPGAPPALDVGGDPVADHRHPLGARDQAAGQLEQVALGLAADLRGRPGGRLDRGEDRAGARPGAAGHRQGRVAAGREQRGAALQRQGRGQQLLVVELPVAGDDDHVGLPSPPRPRAASQPGRRDQLLEGRALRSRRRCRPARPPPPPVAPSPPRRSRPARPRPRSPASRSRCA